MDFDNDGEWNNDAQSGPAIHVPLGIKNTIVEQYRIEWLDVSHPEENVYAKNHIVATLVFASSLRIGDTEYSSARMSMETAQEWKRVDEIIGQEVCHTFLYQIEI